MPGTNPGCNCRCGSQSSRSLSSSSSSSDDVETLIDAACVTASDCAGEKPLRYELVVPVGSVLLGLNSLWCHYPCSSAYEGVFDLVYSKQVTTTGSSPASCCAWWSADGPDPSNPGKWRKLNTSTCNSGSCSTFGGAASFECRYVFGWTGAEWQLGAFVRSSSTTSYAAYWTAADPSPPDLLTPKTLSLAYAVAGYTFPGSLTVTPA